MVGEDHRVTRSHWQPSCNACLSTKQCMNNHDKRYKSSSVNAYFITRYPVKTRMIYPLLISMRLEQGGVGYLFPSMALSMLVVPLLAAGRWSSERIGCKHPISLQDTRVAARPDLRRPWISCNMNTSMIDYPTPLSIYNVLQCR